MQQLQAPLSFQRFEVACPSIDLLFAEDKSWPSKFKNDTLVDLTPIGERVYPSIDLQFADDESWSIKFNNDSLVDLTPIGERVCALVGSCAGKDLLA